jgi:hypothetical protein
MPNRAGAQSIQPDRDPGRALYYLVACAELADDVNRTF